MLGPDIVLHFKSERWRPAAFRGDDVSVLLKGQLKTTAGVSIEAPLAVRFPLGKGTVIFTSFHSEGHVSDVEAKLLRFLALKAVTSAAGGPPDRVVGRRWVLNHGRLRLLLLDAGTVPAISDLQHEKLGPAQVPPRARPARRQCSVSRSSIPPVRQRPSRATRLWQSTWPTPPRAAGSSAPRPRVSRIPTSPPSSWWGRADGGSDATSTRMNPALVKAGNVRFEEINLGNKHVVKEAQAAPHRGDQASVRQHGQAS